MKDLVSKQGWSFYKEKTARAVGETNLKVLNLILGSDGVTRSQIADTLSIHSSNVSRALKKLNELKLIIEIDKKLYVKKDDPLGRLKKGGW